MHSQQPVSPSPAAIELSPAPSPSKPVTHDGRTYSKISTARGSSSSNTRTALHVITWMGLGGAIFGTILLVSVIHGGQNVGAITSTVDGIKQMAEGWSFTLGTTPIGFCSSIIVVGGVLWIGGAFAVKFQETWDSHALQARKAHQATSPRCGRATLSPDPAALQPVAFPASNEIVREQQEQLVLLQRQLHVQQAQIQELAGGIERRDKLLARANEVQQRQLQHIEQLLKQGLDQESTAPLAPGHLPKGRDSAHPPIPLVAAAN